MKFSTFKILLVANYVNIFGFAAFSPLYALYVLNLGLTPSMVGYSWAFFMGTAGVTMIAIGRFENRFKNKRILVPVGFVVQSFGVIGLLLVSNLTHLVLSLSVYALGTAIFVPSLRYLFAKSEDKGEETKEWAIFDGGNMILIAAGSTIGGFLISKWGFNGILWFMLCMHIISAAIASFLLKYRN